MTNCAMFTTNCRFFPTNKIEKLDNRSKISNFGRYFNDDGILS